MPFGEIGNAKDTDIHLKTHCNAEERRGGKQTNLQLGWDAR